MGPYLLFLLFEVHWCKLRVSTVYFFAKPSKSYHSKKKKCSINLSYLVSNPCLSNFIHYFDTAGSICSNHYPTREWTPVRIILTWFLIWHLKHWCDLNRKNSNHHGEELALLYFKLVTILRSIILNKISIVDKSIILLLFNAVTSLMAWR